MDTGKMIGRLLGRLLAVAVAAQLAALGCTDEGPVAPERVLPTGYHEGHHRGMRYGLFVPPSYDARRRYPLVLSLHGSTDTTSWDLSWYHDPIQSDDPPFVLTPKSLVTSTGWGTSWAPGHSPDMRKTLEVVDSLGTVYNLDPDRLYVYGTSMGGFGVFSVLAKEQGRFAAAFSICGGGDPTKAATLAQTPLWIFHGSADRVVPVEQSRRLYQAILQAGGRQVRYTEYAGVGHDAWTPAWKEPTLERWLLAQRRGAVHGPPDPAGPLRYDLAADRRIRLWWPPPAGRTDPDDRIWYYRLFRDAVPIAELTPGDTSFVDTERGGGAAHVYALSVVNYFFQESVRASLLVDPAPQP